MYVGKVLGSITGSINITCQIMDSGWEDNSCRCGVPGSYSETVASSSQVSSRSV
jgi:hypothetical protein